MPNVSQVVSSESGFEPRHLKPRHSGLFIRLSMTATVDGYGFIGLDSKKQELLCLFWGVLFV